jgi:hypothetical protein
VIDQATQAFSRRVEAGVSEQLRTLRPRFEQFYFARIVEHRVRGYVLALLLPLRVAAEGEPVEERPVPAAWVKPSGAALVEAVAGGDPDVLAFVSDEEALRAVLDVCQVHFRGDLPAARRLGEQVCLALGARRGVRLHLASLPNIDNAALSAHVAELDARLAADRVPKRPAPAPAQGRRSTRADSAAGEAAAVQLDDQLALSSAFTDNSPSSRPSRR